MKRAGWLKGDKTSEAVDLGVKPYDKAAQKLVAMAIAFIARVKDRLADLLNVAIEELEMEYVERA